MGQCSKTPEKGLSGTEKKIFGMRVVVKNNNCDKLFRAYLLSVPTYLQYFCTGSLYVHLLATLLRLKVGWAVCRYRGYRFHDRLHTSLPLSGHLLLQRRAPPTLDRSRRHFFMSSCAHKSIFCLLVSLSSSFSLSGGSTKNDSLFFIVPSESVANPLTHTHRL